MTGPASGFEYSDDSVVAKVAVEVSSQDLDNLFQLTQRTEQLRVGLEAVARAEGDFIRYLEQLPEIQERATNVQKSYLDVLTKTVEMQERFRQAAGSLGPPGASPGAGQPDPFAGFTSGMGGVTPGGGAVPQTLQTAQAQLGQLRQDDMRAYASWTQAHAMPTDRQALAAMYPSLQQQQQQADQHVQSREQQKERASSTSMGNAGAAGGYDISANAAEMVLNENQVGSGRPRVGAHGGMPSVPQDGKGGRKSPATGDDAPGEAGGGGSRPGSAGPGMEFMGGVLDGMGLGKLGGVLGMGGAVTGALALNRMIQNAGEDYQQYKNLGMVRGGGAMEGYGYEVQARMMAISPFISTEQSRQVIQAALRDGYTGKEFDTVTEFMASNLKDMNMEVSESVQALRKSVETGGQSMEGFRAQMEAIKEASKDGVRTYDDMKAAVEQNTSTFVDLGMSGGAAGQFAAANAMAFKDNRVLSQVGDRFAAAVGNSPGYLAMVGSEAKLGDVMPMEVPYADPNFTQDAWLPLIRLAHDLKNDPHRVELFRVQANQSLPGLNLTAPEAKALLDYLLTQNPGVAGGAANAQAASAINDRGIGGAGGSSAAQGARSKAVKAVYQPILDLLNPFNGKGLGEEIKAVGSIPKNFWDAEMNATYYSGRYQSPIMDQVIEQYGYNGVELVDKNGNVVELDSNNESTMKRLGSGDLGWRQKGSSGPGTTLADTPATLRTGGAQGVQVGGQLMVGLAPGAEKLLAVPRSVPLTANQLNAYAGWGPAQLNSPPPGDR